MRAGDSQSKETTFAGLPKAVRLWNSAAQAAPTINVAVDLQYDTIAYNYGAFVPHLTGGIMDGVILPEPGLYEIKSGCQIVTIAGNREFLWPRINGTGLAAALPDNQGQSFVDVGYPGDVPTYSETLLCRSGDIITSGFFYTGAAGIGNFVAGVSHLYIEKKGGRY